MMKKSGFIFFVLIIFILFLNYCSYDNKSDDATVIINLGSSRENVAANQAPFRAPANVGSLVLRVDGADMGTIENSYSALQTSISLDIPAGPDRVFTLEALDSDDNIILTGTSLPTELIAGETVDLSIIMDLVWGKIYVSNWDDDTVSVIDGETNTLNSTISVGTNPFGIGVNPNTNKIYVSNYTSNDVYVIDALTDTVITGVAYPIPLAGDLRGVGVNPVLIKSM